jgi:hypothetical protein
LQKWLGESPPKVEETKLRRGPAEGTAEAPVAAKERWQRQGNPRGRDGNCPEGSPTPPLYTQAPLRPDYLAKVSPDNPAPPDIPPKGADIPAWEARN